jgi:hypothetical protein
MERTDTQPHQPSPFAQPWPDGVIARYLTIAGATVDLRPASDGKVQSKCTGCGEFWYPSSGGYIRREAQAHAERCRALPHPEAQR